MGIYDSIKKSRRKFKPPYTPKTREERLKKLIEEIGEFIQTYGKAGRFGILNYHPADPSQETNAEAMLRELDDVIKAATSVKVDLTEFTEKHKYD